MKAWTVILLFLVTTGFPSSCWCEEGYGDVQVSRVFSVYDGDTFMVDLDSFPPILGERISVRVAGIDTPEIRSKDPNETRLAKEAREVTLKLLSSASIIILRNMRRGKYFRILADVYVDGRSLAEELLRRDLAQRYYGGKRPAWSFLSE